MQGGSVSNCYAHVAVRLESSDRHYLGNYVGGLLGSLRDASLSASYSSGNVSANLSASETLYIGGLAGVLLNAASSIRNCFAVGNINARS
ncbi:MAG: hypothetical protein CRN43_14590, partial [Candidatus Nephrothrix sp. EaCA]